MNDEAAALHADPERAFDGQYQLGAEIGAGVLGVVYRGVDERLDKPVAIKVWHARLEEGASQREQYDAEARALTALEHPNLVAVTDYGIAGKAPYLVMELLEGQTLEARMRASALPRSLTQTFMQSVLRGLGYMHMRGVVHRHLNPENIFLQKSGDEETLKLLDLGLESLPANTNGQVARPSAYDSPEQDAGADLDGRSDVYAAGVLLLHMLAGHEPARETLRAASDSADALAKIIPTAIPEVVAFIARAVGSERSARFGNADQMLRALLELPTPWTTDAEEEAAAEVGAASTQAPPAEAAQAELGVSPTIALHAELGDEALAADGGDAAADDELDDFEAVPIGLVAKLRKRKRQLSIIAGALALALTGTVAAAVISANAEQKAAEEAAAKAAEAAEEKKRAAAKAAKRAAKAKAEAPPSPAAEEVAEEAEEVAEDGSEARAAAGQGAPADGAQAHASPGGVADGKSPLAAAGDAQPPVGSSAHDKSGAAAAAESKAQSAGSQLAGAGKQPLAAGGSQLAAAPGQQPLAAGGSQLAAAPGRPPLAAEHAADGKVPTAADGKALAAADAKAPAAADAKAPAAAARDDLPPGAILAATDARQNLHPDEVPVAAPPAAADPHAASVKAPAPAPEPPRKLTPEEIGSVRHIELDSGEVRQMLSLAIGSKPRGAAENPWDVAVPDALRALRESIAKGERGTAANIKALRRYNAANPEDVYGHLLLAGFYANRGYSLDALDQLDMASRIDPSSRGAPEMLRHALDMVARGIAEMDAVRFIDRVYGRDANAAINQRLKAKGTDAASQRRLRQLQARLTTKRR